MYALIAWGGQQSNQRPRTALAYLVQKPRGALMHARIVTADGLPKYKRDKPCTEQDVLHTFGFNLPSPAEVRAAKRTLWIVPASDPRFRTDRSAAIRSGQ